ncbi:MAG: DUF305 domain-containing protein [Candidatus Saccharimonadales bacterium]
MQTKPLLYGLAGFFLGGLLVAIAATTFNKPNQDNTSKANAPMSSMSIDAMTADLQNKTGDDFDAAFIASMIAHHEGAVAMAKLSAKNAKHEEIKTLSESIISAQEKEIAEMKQWQIDWGYSQAATNHSSMGH